MVFWVFVVAVVVQCGYALWFAVAQMRGGQTQWTLPEERSCPVSVIICAKNEGANLRKNLPVVLGQRYEAGYEVVVVNDASTDDTATVLAELTRQHTHLRVVTVSPDEVRTLKGKKHALNRGVAAARHEWLLLTDADCVPAGDSWMTLMIENRERRAGSGERKIESGERGPESGVEIGLGYGGYNRRAGLLNVFVRWETMHTWLQYSSYARAGVPYMGVGRNMACRKSVLLHAQNDPRWNVLPSGDDDMLVQLMGTRDNVAMADAAAAHTYSDAKATWAEWIQQKRRHLSTGKYYKRSTKLLLATYAVTQAQVWGAFAVCYMACVQLLPAGVCHMPAESCGWLLPLLAARCLLTWSVWAMAAVRLRQKSLILWLPLMDIGWLWYNFAFLPWITWKNKRQWT